MSDCVALCFSEEAQDDFSLEVRYMCEGSDGCACLEHGKDESLLQLIS